MSWYAKYCISIISTEVHLKDLKDNTWFRIVQDIEDSKCMSQTVHKDPGGKKHPNLSKAAVSRSEVFDIV